MIERLCCLCRHPAEESARDGVAVGALGPRLRLLGLVAVVLATSGCTGVKEYVRNGFKVGPNYCHAQGVTAPQWIDAIDARVRSEPADLTEWWGVFQDPVLDELIHSAAAQNLTLREAGWRVMEARAQLCYTRGNLFPQRQGVGGMYERIAASGETRPPGREPVFFDQWSMGLSFSWELDFWGRFRRAVSAAEESLQAKAANYQAVLVTMLGDVASNYVQVRTLDLRIRLLESDVTRLEKILSVALRRREAGRVGELDVVQARSNVAGLAANIPRLRSERREASNRLCLLLGIPPVDLDQRLGSRPIPFAPKEVVVGIPADLLRRRPDVLRAEFEAAAQAEQIGIAESWLYPMFSLDGTMGYQAQDFSKLFNSDAVAGTVGPKVQWAILNYGRIRSLMNIEDARFQALLAAYQGTVVQANVEAENALVQFLQAQERTAWLDKSVADYRTSVEIVTRQYENGAVDLTRVIQLEQDLSIQQDLQATSQGEIALGLIRVYQALGGGWPMSAAPPEPAPEPVPETAPEVLPEPTNR